jgi:bacterioferritin
MLERARAMEEESVHDYNQSANECSANADAGTKKVFEALVDDEERHFSQYDMEMEKIKKFGEQFLALQSIEGSKAVPAGTTEA